VRKGIEGSAVKKKNGLRSSEKFGKFSTVMEKMRRGGEGSPRGHESEPPVDNLKKKKSKS